MKFVIQKNPTISLHDLAETLNHSYTLQLATEAKKAVIACRKFLDNKTKSQQVYYGINTGFGSLCNVIIPANDMAQLQTNLMLSHACGCGERVPDAIVKLMLLLKVQSLAQGNSGVSLDVIERLIFFYNNNILPIVYQQGSLGASGDLAPLAHLCVPLIGEGEVSINGTISHSKIIEKKFGLKPLTLQSKEGLALLNGTQFMSAYGAYACIKSLEIAEKADLIASMSLDAFACKSEPFNDLIHKARNQEGQRVCASNINNILHDSRLFWQEKKQTQDPYSFRCIPQVHGAGRDAIQYACTILQREINAVTDNPNIFPQEDLILSGGNFHGQPLALAMDFLAIALAEFANISERRTYLLISGQRDLPPFLIKNSGINSGFMIPQYTAASIVSQNKQLCTPASVDSIVSSNGQEDHVSMGANSATKLLRVVENTFSVLAIELLNSAQALDFRGVRQSSTRIKKIHNAFRKKINFIEKDTFMHAEINKSIDFLKSM